MLKWREEYLEKIAKLSNGKLFAEFLEVHTPDDYDGCHSSDGAWLLDVVMDLLVKRLKAEKFLPRNWKDE